MARADVEELVDRLATRLAWVVCPKCGGRGIDAMEGGPCKVCLGSKRVPLEGEARQRWIETATQEVEAHCLDCEHRSGSVVPKGGVRL